MDKDLLRIVIIVVGGLVILGMILWGMFNKGPKKRSLFYGKNNSIDNIDPSLVVHTEDDEFDIIPLSTRENDQLIQVKTQFKSKYVPEVQHSDSDLDLGLDLILDPELQLDREEVKNETPVSTQKSSQHLPALLQLSIVAQAKEGFHGTQLLEACEQVGLVYGSVKVFERLDILSRVDYAVASMIDPGIFPGDNWKTYRCPGITFFMQPRELDNAAVVFDEMISTIGQLSTLLKGDVLDQNQQTLTEEALHEIEASLV